jgi:hypothetical protein
MDSLLCTAIHDRPIASPRALSLVALGNKVALPTPAGRASQRIMANDPRLFNPIGVLQKHMLYHSKRCTMLFIRHYFYRIPAVPLPKYLKFPAFRGAVLAKRPFILRACVGDGMSALSIS